MEGFKKIIFKINCKDLDRVKKEYEKETEKTSQKIAYLSKINFDTNIFFNIAKIS